ncbi:protein MutS [Seminavis robusta]|uniref:Protein MutS n=1 Tax=Seminavis robusta TaxID=568900 RepID=A0A9N8HHA5_9STRA|nr:protein MutS [Seminavis robusta]|eukprot:Sro552_g165070.1 protein MutS (1091) ;mRNA; f:23686-27316
MSGRQRKRFKASNNSKNKSSNESVASRLRSSGQGESSHHIVCAISENLAKETCVASLDTGAPVHVRAIKQGNGSAYAETLDHLKNLQPDECLINEGRRNSQLVRLVEEFFAASNQNNDQQQQNPDGAAKTVVVKYISRTFFDQTKGSQALEGIARDDFYDTSVANEYIVLSSVHAVLQYTQQHLGITFLKKSVRLEVNSGGEKMIIDRCSLMQLELLANAKSGKTKNSILASIDCTKTSVGERLLRSSLMAPSTRTDTIASRLDLVDAFLADKNFFYTVMQHLQWLPCLDKMVTNIALVPKRKNKDLVVTGGSGSTISKNEARKGISALVNIKTTLAALPQFTKVLEDRLMGLNAQEVAGTQDDASATDLETILLNGLGQGPASIVTATCKHHLLKAIVAAMKNTALKDIFATVSQVLSTSTTSAHRNSHMMRHEECWALRAEPDSIMSVIRSAFTDNVNDIYAAADRYAENHGFSVKVKFSSHRGYYLVVPDGINLPPEFIQPARSGNFIMCTTEEVLSRNIRAQDNVQDLLLMTDEKIQQVLDVVRSQYAAIAMLSDAIALLDLCHSFADCVTQKATQPWCRPMLTDNGNNKIVIRNGRYLGEATSYQNTGRVQFVANDTYTNGRTIFTTITGINGSGKSTYLKQIATIVILAHCGGYVPAEFACIPIRDWLCTRIGNTDDQEHNISTFMLEMKEVASICRQATSRSLALIDELGRATSNEDGVALAWAVSESLLQRGALTFFVTHYSQLTALGKMYSSVQNQHLAATVTRGESGRIAYTYKVSSGACAVATEYGVDLAGVCGWPAEILEAARQVESDLSASNEETQPAAKESQTTCLGHAQSLVNHVFVATSPSAPDQPLDLELIKQKLMEDNDNYDEVFRGLFEPFAPPNLLMMRDGGQPLSRNATQNDVGHSHANDDESQHLLTQPETTRGQPQQHCPSVTTRANPQVCENPEAGDDMNGRRPSVRGHDEHHPEGTRPVSAARDERLPDSQQLGASAAMAEQSSEESSESESSSDDSDSDDSDATDTSDDSDCISMQCVGDGGSRYKRDRLGGEEQSQFTAGDKSGNDWQTLASTGTGMDSCRGS